MKEENYNEAELTLDELFKKETISLKSPKEQSQYEYTPYPKQKSNKKSKRIFFFMLGVIIFILFINHFKGDKQDNIYNKGKSKGVQKKAHYTKEEKKNKDKHIIKDINPKKDVKIEPKKEIKKMPKKEVKEVPKKEVKVAQKKEVKIPKKEEKVAPKKDVKKVPKKDVKVVPKKDEKLAPKKIVEKKEKVKVKLNIKPIKKKNI